MLGIQEEMKSEKAGQNLNLVAFALLEAAALVLAEVAVAETYTAESGGVQAELFYRCEEPGEYGKCLKNLSELKILRKGKVLLETTIAPEYGRPTTTYDLSGGVQVQNLDGDREPEVIVDTYTGEAHCCNISLIYRYDPKQNQYVSLVQDWQHSGYRLEDLNHDGTPEFISGDDRFAYQFASYAGSARPIKIWQYRQGDLVDVTRQYPQEIYRSAYQHWQNYQAAQAQGYETKGILAGYLAAKYLLEQEEDGWQRVRQTYQKGDREVFFTKLQQFLEETGYVRE